jgi:hypothetical protein
MTMAGIDIDGDGISSLCCAHLLARSSIPYSIQSPATRKQPAILIGTQAASLLKDACQAHDLLHTGWKINRRVVQWGAAKEPVCVPHDAIAIPEETLVAGMRDSLEPALKNNKSTINWRIVTSNRESNEAFDVYGQRLAFSQKVTLKHTEDARSCWTESTRHGWLFLLPFNSSEAALIAAAYEPVKAMEESRLIVPRLASELSQATAAPIAPRLARALYGDGMIQTGTAAMRFDPLCGEGAGHAAREAYLTVAVIRAALRGEPAEDLLDHYSKRLKQAFLRHLIICSSFYSSGGNSDFWRSEENALQNGISELQSQIQRSASMQFRFKGLDLEAIPLSQR